MGFFSWKTVDTNKSISNVYSAKGALPVKVLVPENFAKEYGSEFVEKNYEGYGVFGGRDIYALVAQWNFPEKCKNEDGTWKSDDECRDVGIDIACFDKDHAKLKYPFKLVSLDFDKSYEEIEGFSLSDEFQGYFY